MVSLLYLQCIKDGKIRQFLGISTVNPLVVQRKISMKRRNLAISGPFSRGPMWTVLMPKFWQLLLWLKI